jgi:hypothetical protein
MFRFRKCSDLRGGQEAAARLPGVDPFARQVPKSEASVGVVAVPTPERSSTAAAYPRAASPSPSLPHDREQVPRESEL